MDRLETKRQDATVAQQDAQQSGDSRATVDLTPLTELIERQAHELADARAAAVLWQERARTLEQRLIAIEAGTPNPETTPEPATIAPGSSPANGRGTSGIRAWVKRLWNG